MPTKTSHFPVSFAFPTGFRALPLGNKEIGLSLSQHSENCFRESDKAADGRRLRNHQKQDREISKSGAEVGFEPLLAGDVSRRPCFFWHLARAKEGMLRAYARKSVVRTCE